MSLGTWETYCIFCNIAVVKLASEILRDLFFCMNFSDVRCRFCSEYS